MKIKKEKKIILEAVELKEDAANELQKELDKVPETGEVELDDASTKEVAADIQQSAEEAGKEVSAEDAAKEAKKVEAVADLIRNPYGTAKLGLIKRVLQRSLDKALDQKEVGISGNYQNVLIYGLAGFGKTSIVEEFCKEHNLNMFECDAKSLDTATVGGIPYPKKDARTGELTQMPIASKFWDGLNKPNTVIFLDELNRANGRVRGTLLSLINNHILPITTENPDGETTTVKYFPNILFTVIAINPADDIFQDNNPLDPAEVSRNAAIIEQGPDVKEFLSHLTEIYTAIEKNPNIPQQLKDKYSGQFAIAKAILTDRGFSFDDADDVRSIYLSSGNKIGNYLNYRTFLMTLLRSNGTKSDYLDIIRDESGFQDSKKQMIKNILATYTDKPTTGNNIWNQQTPQAKARAVKTDAEIIKALSDFGATLD